jgi:hypothetical protein
VAAGAAVAYWAVTGTGSAGATTASTSAVALSSGTAAAQLVPGGTSDVVLTVTNPNAGQVHVGSLALDSGQGTGGFGVDAGHAGCALSTLGFTTQTNSGAGWTVPGNASLALTLPNALSMGAGAANACQGAVFTVYLRVAS